LYLIVLDLSHGPVGLNRRLLVAGVSVSELVILIAIHSVLVLVRHHVIVELIGEIHNSSLNINWNWTQ